MKTSVNKVRNWSNQPRQQQQTQEDTHRLPQEVVEGDLAEVRQDIEFLLNQIVCNIANYSQAELDNASKKISELRQKADLVMMELENGN